MVEVIQPRTREIVVSNPLGKQPLESPLDVQQAVFKSPPDPSFWGRPLVLVLDVVVVADERLELLAARQFLDLAPHRSQRAACSASAVVAMGFPTLARSPIAMCRRAAVTTT